MMPADGRSELDPEVLGELSRVASAPVQAGELQWCAFAIGLHGHVVHAEAFGRGGPDTPVVIMSPSKTVQDAGLWQLISEGSVDPAAPVADYVPEFGARGKARITVEQVMTHTGGFPGADLDWPEWADRGQRRAAFRRWELEWMPGSRYAYHPASGSWVLAEVITAVSGLDHREFLRRRLFEPLGLAGVGGVSLGEPVDEQGAVLPHVTAFPDEMRRALPPMFLDETGRSRIPGGVDLPEGRAAGFPGAGCVGTASGLAALYQAFLHDPAGLWGGALLADVTGRIRYWGPGRWGGRVLRTLSFFLAGPPSDRPGSEREFFGSTVSAATFGHDGLGGNLAWSDPATGVSFVFLTNTVTFLPWHQHPRASALSSLAGRLRG